MACLGVAVSLVTAGVTALGGSGSGAGASAGAAAAAAFPRPFFAGGGFGAGSGVALVLGVDSFLPEARELFFGGGGGGAFEARVRSDRPELTSI